jgi:hypothetical protein
MVWSQVIWPQMAGVVEAEADGQGQCPGGG